MRTVSFILIQPHASLGRTLTLALERSASRKIYRVTRAGSITWLPRALRLALRLARFARCPGSPPLAPRLPPEFSELFDELRPRDKLRRAVHHALLAPAPAPPSLLPSRLHRRPPRLGPSARVRAPPGTRDGPPPPTTNTTAPWYGVSPWRGAGAGAPRRLGIEHRERLRLVRGLVRHQRLHRARERSLRSPLSRDLTPFATALTLWP